MGVVKILEWILEVSLIESLDFCVLGHGIGSYYQALHVLVIRRQVPEQYQYNSVGMSVTTLPGQSKA